MKRLSLKLPVLIALTVALYSSCNLLADLDCGDSQNPRELVGPYWDFTTGSSSLPGQVYTYLENGQRFFITDMYVDNLCTEEHTKVDYEVSLMGVHTMPLDIVGTTSWNFLYEEESVLSNNAIPPHTPVNASQEIGLFQAFGENPGSILLRLSLSFPTTNSLSFAQDSAYFVDHVSQMNIYVDGYYPKD